MVGLLKYDAPAVSLVQPFVRFCLVGQNCSYFVFQNPPVFFASRSVLHQSSREGSSTKGRPEGVCQMLTIRFLWDFC